jgi:hypothetical protein
MAAPLNLYWGDFHKHLEDIDHADEIIEFAKYHLDFYCVLCYPFKWERRKGARVETVGQRPEFQEWWEKLGGAARRHNSPGEFVTFLGYEWHGNRTRYGDHNVIYPGDEGPLDDAWRLEDLYQSLRGHGAIAIPHHTGYYTGRRGKDWSVWDPVISPIVEVFSSHGSSEAVEAPRDMVNNNSMGPRTTGGTLVDALGMGHRLGVIASNDGSGLPGSWSRGVAGVWAEDLTRESIWEAIRGRRTIAATGDRIRLWFSMNDRPMGSVIPNEGEISAKVAVSCPQPLERIELIGREGIERTYLHRIPPGELPGAFRILIELGWGPSGTYGFKGVAQNWSGRIELREGDLLGVCPRFQGLGQRYTWEGTSALEFELTTERDTERYRQGFILDLDANGDTEIGVELHGASFTVRLEEAIRRGHLFPLLDESIQRVHAEFGIDEGELQNPDIYYHNARKIRVHRAFPRQGCEAEVEFEGLEGENRYHYVRVRQTDGQMAWSSPIWVSRS